MEDKWYKSEQVWIAIILVALAVSLSLAYRESRKPEEKEVFSFGPNKLAPVGKTTMPVHDIPGSRDFSEIGRMPDSMIIWQKEGTIDGLKAKTEKYISVRPPMAAEIYFTDKLLRKYIVVRDNLTTNDGYGWTGIYLSPQNDEMIAVISTSKLIGPPPGGAENPTEISVMRVKRDAK